MQCDHFPYKKIACKDRNPRGSGSFQDEGRDWGNAKKKKKSQRMPKIVGKHQKHGRIIPQENLALPTLRF